MTDMKIGDEVVVPKYTKQGLIDCRAYVTSVFDYGVEVSYREPYFSEYKLNDEVLLYGQNMWRRYNG